MAQDDSFRYEIEKSEDRDSGKLTTITCHGRLVAGNSGEISDLVKPMLPLGGPRSSRASVRITNLMQLFSS